MRWRSRSCAAAASRAGTASAPACRPRPGAPPLLAVGDIDAPVYPRSAIKPFQALPLLETGAAEAFGVSDEEVALACASHGGEPAHVERVAAWLARLGLEERHLACGPHPPMHAASAAALAASGAKPTRLHNNCSGKHTGMLAACLHLGLPVEGYASPTHPLQRRITAAMAELAGLPDLEAPGTDGCSLPAFVMPLRALAHAAARLAAPDDLTPERAAALRRAGNAMRAHPLLVAGTGRLCTALMRHAPDVVAKTGAEGVFLASVPSRGLGVALKAEDGASRAAEVALLALLDHLGTIPPDARAALGPFARPKLRDFNGNEVGEVRPAPGWPA
jgi:L-asparaginase II